jgi:hypothetical protein
LVNNFGFIRDIGQSLLGEGGPDDLSGKVLHQIIVVRWNPRAAVDVEDGIFQPHDKLDNFFADLPFPQEPIVNLVRKERFQGLRVECRGYRNGPLSKKPPSVQSTWQWGLKLRKSPKLWTAMTAPGTIFFREKKKPNSKHRPQPFGGAVPSRAIIG